MQNVLHCELLVVEPVSNVRTSKQGHYTRILPGDVADEGAGVRDH